MVASILVEEGEDIDVAFQTIEAARGCSVPDTPSEIGSRNLPL